MKIVHQSDAQMIVEHRPWPIAILVAGLFLTFVGGSLLVLAQGEILGGLLLGLLGVGVPAVIGTMMVQHVHLALDRAGGKVTRTTRSVRGVSRASFALDRLSHASVDVFTDSESGGKSRRLDLHLTNPAETLGVTPYHTEGKGADAVCAALNDWLGARGGKV